MPSSVLSHQAPGLFLKVKFPKKLDGTALCFGTFVPDLGVILRPFFPFNIYGFSHSLIGQILWTIPLAILATIIFSRFLGPMCANIASKERKLFEPLKYFGIDQWNYLRNKRFDIIFFIIATYSALIGGFTHVLLDLPSHADVYLFYPWTIWQSPPFLLYPIVDFGTISIGSYTIEASIPVYFLLWQLETHIGLLISLYYLRYIKKHNLLRKWYEEIK
ncbi:MAG: DUF4184 family protein [Promethearchaeota archaeon]